MKTKFIKTTICIIENEQSNFTLGRELCLEKGDIFKSTYWDIYWEVVDIPNMATLIVKEVSKPLESR